MHFFLFLVFWFDFGFSFKRKTVERGVYGGWVWTDLGSRGKNMSKYEKVLNKYLK